MFGYLDLDVVTATAAGQLENVQAYLDANPHHLNSRSMFQSTLLHTAARNGHDAIVSELLKRGIHIDAPDHGGLKRTALHWACEAGHVGVVELLVSQGADTRKMLESAAMHAVNCPIVAKCDTGVCMAPCASISRSLWRQPMTCPQTGQDKGHCNTGNNQTMRFAWLAHADTSGEDNCSATALSTNHAVQLALERPCWTPDNNHMWPPRFKDMVRLLVLNLLRPREAPAASDGQEVSNSAEELSASAASAQHQQCQPLPIPWECCQDIIALAAYPVSIWL